MNPLLKIKPIWWTHRRWMLARGKARVRVGDQRARFHLGEKLHYQYLVGWTFEREQLSAFLDLLNEDDVVYEVGAHIGSWTVFLAQRVRAGRVVAFEPDPINRQTLQANLDLNDLENVDVHAVAISDRAGQADLGLHPKPGDGRHSLIVGSGNQKTIQVATLRLDDVPAELGAPAPTALKIDCEGAEGLVLDGAPTLLADPIRLIFLEVHHGRIEATGHDPDELLARLTGGGFTIREQWSRHRETIYVLAR